MDNGIKIMNLQGSNILKNNLDGLDIFKEYAGVFTNSLLMDKLSTMGLNITKNKTTRDIITVEFGYGYTPQEAKITNVIDKLVRINNSLFLEIKVIEDAKKLLIKRIEKKPLSEEILKIKDNIRNNKAQIKNIKLEAVKMCVSKDNIRDILYKNGFYLDFFKKNKVSKKYILSETVKYKFWFRTPSKSRVGDVVFINEKLYDIKKWQRMGLEIPENEYGRIVEMAAYESLTSSSICGRITINPDNILVVNDIKSFFDTECALVKTDSKGECFVDRKKYKVNNTLFDGQALLEDSLWDATDKSGMILLRQHFFKACAFRTYLSNFFIDWCIENEKDYNTFTVEDRYHNHILIKNILMITTENAMKWEKFTDIGASFDYWKKVVNDDCNIFGICKKDHVSKYGEYQRASYQMVNTLDINTNQAKNLADETVKFVNDMKKDNEKYCEFLKITSSGANGNDMIVDLYNHNKLFDKSKFFREYKKRDISDYVKTLRNGKLLLNADNLTITGNPYIMLLHAVGQVPLVNNVIIDKKFTDITLPVNDEYISVYTKRFKDGEMLASFRNPHNSPNNCGYNKVFKHELMEKYFNFSKNIMAINMIQTEEQDLKNSEDEDSDFNYVTNNKIAVESASKIFRKYPCIVNQITEKSKSYINCIQSNIDIDNGLAKSKYEIGSSSNLAQLAMSWYWDSKTKQLTDNSKEIADVVCIMSVLAQCAIDNAKREYSVDVSKEIRRIANLDCMKRTIKNSKGNTIKAKPMFWQYISKTTKEESLINCSSPMNYIQPALDDIIGGSTTKDAIDNIKFIKLITGKANNKQVAKIEEIVKTFDDIVKEHNIKFTKIVLSKADQDKWLTKQDILLDNEVKSIGLIVTNPKTMQILIIKALSKGGDSNKFKRKLLNALYLAHKVLFLSIFVS